MDFNTFARILPGVAGVFLVVDNGLMKAHLLSIVAVALISLLARASEIVTWTDGTGAVHYTDDASKVPAKYKGQKFSGAAINQVAGEEESDSSTASEQSTAERENPQDENLWRQRFHDAYALIRSLEEQIAEDKASLKDQSDLPTTGQGYMDEGHRIVFRDPLFLEPKRRLARNQSALERAKLALDNLERQASSQAIPREWRVP